MDWRLAMRSSQVATTAQAAVVFQRDSVMRKAESLTGETQGLALQRPHPDVNVSWLVVQRATAPRIAMVSALARGLGLVKVLALVRVSVSVSVLAMVSVLVKVLAMAWALVLVRVIAFALAKAMELVIAIALAMVTAARMTVPRWALSQGPCSILP